MTHPSPAAAQRLLERALRATRSIAGDAPILIDVPDACPAASRAVRSLGGTRISHTTCMLRGTPVPIDFTRIGSFASMGSKG